MSKLPETMRANVLTEARTLCMEDRPVPVPGTDEVLIRVVAVGVCGSDAHYYREGRLGEFVVERPLVLGHELSGVIVATGPNVSEARVGERVAVEPQRPCAYCAQCRAGRYNLCPFMEFFATPPIDGAFCDYVVIQTSFAHRIPENVSSDAAALLEPLSVAVAAVRKAGIVPASTVLISGAGPIGIISAQTARAFGASRVIVTDVVPERRNRALNYGATEVLDPLESNSLIAELGVDAYIDASGAPTAVRAGIIALRPAGVAVLVGMGHSSMELPVERIQNRELIVTGVFRYVNTWPAAIHLLSSGSVELDTLVTGRFSLEEASCALEAEQNSESLKSIVVI